MVYFCLKLATLFLAEIQSHVRGNNCLRDNAGVLDADFSFFNRLENHLDFDEKDIAKHITVFKTRFRHGRQIEESRKEWIHLLAGGVSLYNQANKNNFQIFLSGAPTSDLLDNITKGIEMYEQEFEAVRNFNSGNAGFVAGLYVRFRMDSFQGQLEALEAVFGPRENSKFPIGGSYKNCLIPLKNKFWIKVLQRLEFFSCDLYPKPRSSVEKSADEVLQTCLRIRDTAASLNVTGTLMCRTRYPTLGTTSEGVVGSVSDMGRFWCRIVEKLKSNKNYPQIIMQSSFDETVIIYEENGTKQNQADRNSGWWML